MTPEGQIYGQNSKFLQLWGLYSHISASINVKFGTGEQTFHIYWGNMPPLPGKKNIFGPLSKNNGMAALREGLPVKNNANTNQLALDKTQKTQKLNLNQKLHV